MLVPLPALDPDGNVVVERDVAEVDGSPITAEQCQALLDQLGVARPGTGVQAPRGGNLNVVVTDAVTGAQRAVSTVPGLRRGARKGGLSSPASTDRYEPTESQDRFVRRRDRTCRFPSCSRAAVHCDVDHAIPLAEWRHRLPKSLLPVPATSSAEDPFTRLAVQAARRRDLDRHHTKRHYWNDQATRPAHRSADESARTVARSRSDISRPATLLSR